MARRRPLACLPIALVLLTAAGRAEVVPRDPVGPPAAVDEADEQYQFLAGLCDKQMWPQAVREGRAFLERFPRHARADWARYRLASALFELDRKPEAAHEYAALERRDDFEFAAEVAFRRGQCALAAGDAAGASQSFELARARAARDPERAYLSRPAAFFLGEALFQLERYAPAAEAYRAALAGAERTDEYVRECEYGLVWCAAREGRHAEVVSASEAYQQAWGRDPAARESLIDVLFLRAEALLAQGDARGALAAYRAVTSGAHADSALRGTAFAQAGLNEHAAAAASFSQLLERFPESRHAGEAALQAGVEYLRAGDARAARRALEDERVAEGAEAAYWIARAQRECGDSAAALATLERALAARPEREWAGRLAAARGDALGDLGRAGEAAQAYRSAGGDYGLYAAAVAALNAGDAQQALRSASELLEQRPDSTYRADCLLVAGEACLTLERYAQAERHFQTLLELQGDGAPDEDLRTRAASRAAWSRYLAGDHAEASRRFAQLARARPDTPEGEEALFLAGRAGEEAGDAETAARHWQAWLERYPRGQRRVEVLLGLARVGSGGDAAQHLRAAVDAAPPGALRQEALFQLGEVLARAGEHERAAQVHARLLEESPDSEFARAARYALAWNRYEQGQAEAAAQALEPLLRDAGAPAELVLAARELAVWVAAAREDAAASARAWSGLAEVCADDERRMAALEVVLGVCRKSGQPEAAKPLIERFLAEVADRDLAARALVEAAWLALDAHETVRAEAALRAALRVAPAEARSPKAGQALAEALFFVGEAHWAGGDGERAAQLYGLAAEDASGELAARVTYKQGFAALQAADLDAAEQAFAQLVSEHADSPLHGEGLYLLGETRFRRGDFAAAVGPLARLVEESPRHESVPKALLRLGVARGRLGQWAECEEALGELLRRESDFPQANEAQLWRGRALAERGDARAARAALSIVVERDKGDLGAQARLALGELAERAGDLDAALSEYLKVGVLYAHAPSVAEALFRSGRCLEAQGQLDSARARYSEVLEQHPDEPCAARARERLRAL